jgi:hypothetical protein
MWLNHGAFGTRPRHVLEVQRRLRERIESSPSGRGYDLLEVALATTPDGTCSIRLKFFCHCVTTANLRQIILALWQQQHPPQPSGPW